MQKVQVQKPEPLQAEIFDKQNKSHLTQMATLNAGNRTTRSGSTRKLNADDRFTTVGDSYFSKARQTTQITPSDVEALVNHYKFHKGTTYSIGNERGTGPKASLTQESYVVKQREDNTEVLPGRRNQEQFGIKNQNKIPNYMIGEDTPAVRGGDDSATVHKRSNSMYNQALTG